jgi:hypothetical protein
MFNKIIVTIVLSFLTSLSYAANKNTVDVTSEFIMPDDMKDCKIYRMNSDGFGSVFLYVTRCPNGKTETTKLDKTSTTVLSGDDE